MTTTFDDGTETTTTLGIFSGTLFYEMITAFGYELIVTNGNGGIPSVPVIQKYEIGTTTGLVNPYEGRIIVDGAWTNELTGTTTTFDEGIGAITTDGIEAGTFSYEMTTAFDCDSMVMNGNGGIPAVPVIQKYEIGTTTGLVNPYEGTTIDDGAETHESTGTERTFWLGIGEITTDGTEAGTFDH
jgi:hypothetical protein